VKYPPPKHHWKALPCSGAYTRASERARILLLLLL
jgi:hypothetical protein